jgi:hypothetical protein
LILESLAVVWALGVANLDGGEPATAQPLSYLVSIRLTEKNPDGQTTVLCEPNLVVLENRAASFKVGGTQDPPQDLALPEPSFSGTQVDLHLFRHEGRLIIDLRGSVTDPARSDAEGVRLTTIGLRMVEVVTPGKPTIVTQKGSNLRWELLVEEIRPGAAPQDVLSRRLPRTGTGMQ